MLRQTKRGALPVNAEMVVVIVLAVWCVLSTAGALFLGRAIKVSQQPGEHRRTAADKYGPMRPIADTDFED